jgi:putative transposase
VTKRRDTAAGFFHVTCHSVWDGALFRDDLDRANYVHWLARTSAETGVICVAVCLMTTHAHLVLGVEEMQLADCMQRLNFRYASRFNSRHRRRGRVFGSPYHATRIEDDNQLLIVYRYVARNPAEAGMVARPEDWPWSSYGAAIGASATFDFVNPAKVLACLGGVHEIAAARLRRFVDAS